MSQHEVNVHGIGKVLFVRSNRARRVTIAIKPIEGIRVTFPLGLSLASAEQFVLQKQDWIHKQLPRIAAYETQLTIFDNTSTFKTKFHTLDIQHWPHDNIRIAVKDRVIKARCPKNIPFTSHHFQTPLRDAIIETMRGEAKFFLPKRVRDLANAHGFEFGKVAVKNAKTRWGSCSYQNNINLNIHLMRLPDNLTDYVILHELAHTKVKNHSRDFWNLVEEICDGNGKKWDKELNKYHISIW